VTLVSRTIILHLPEPSHYPGTLASLHETLRLPRQRWNNKTHRIVASNTATGTGSMAPPAWPQPPPPRFEYPYHNHVPTDITPCDATKVRGGTASHLLCCGHIVVVQDSDTRCGQNCAQVFGLSASVVNSALTTGLCNDILYCVTCNGITLQEFKAMHSDSNTVQMIRNCVPLTYGVLQTLPSVDGQEARLSAILCKPFRNTSGTPFDWKLVHRLRCGHEVREMDLLNSERIADEQGLVRTMQALCLQLHQRPWKQ
jgi:hypothetical protein